MPKFNFLFKPGEAIPKNINSLLNECFSEKDLLKFEKFGGRIQLSLTTPFTDRKSQNSKLKIDDKIINKIINDTTYAKKTFKTLTKKQLEVVAKKLNYPTTSKNTVSELRKELIDYLESGKKWSNITGSSNPKKDT